MPTNIGFQVSNYRVEDVSSLWKDFYFLITEKDWRFGVHFPLSSNGDRCSAVNHEVFSKQFSDGKTYSFELRRIRFVDSCAPLDDMIDSLGWHVRELTDPSLLPRFPGQDFAIVFFGSDSYLNALGFLVSKIKDLEDSYES